MPNATVDVTNQAITNNSSVQPFAFTGLVFTPTGITGSYAAVQNVTLSAQFSGVAPGPIAVALTLTQSGYTGTVTYNNSLAVAGGASSASENVAIGVSPSGGSTGTVTITGTYGGVSKTAVLTLSAAADFTLTGSSSSGTVVQGGAAAVDNLTLTSVNGYNLSTALTISGLPAGVTAVFSPATLTPTSGSANAITLTLTPSATATAGTAALVITAAGGGVTHTLNYALTVSGLGGLARPVSGQLWPR